MDAQELTKQVPAVNVVRLRRGGIDLAVAQPEPA